MSATPILRQPGALLTLTLAGCVLLSVLVGSLVYEALTAIRRGERAPWYAMPVAVLSGAVLFALLWVLFRG